MHESDNGQSHTWHIHTAEDAPKIRRSVENSVGAIDGVSGNNFTATTPQALFTWQLAAAFHGRQVPDIGARQLCLKSRSWHGVISLVTSVDVLASEFINSQPGLPKRLIEAEEQEAAPSPAT